MKNIHSPYITPTAIPSGILCNVTANTIIVVRPVCFSVPLPDHFQHEDVESNDQVRVKTIYQSRTQQLPEQTIKFPYSQIV